MNIDSHIIDFHGHVGRWDGLDMADDPNTMLNAMDRAGIDRSCLFNIFHPHGRTGNDLTAAFVAHVAPRFPNANFVAGHSGNIEPYRAQAIAVARAHPNVFLETCSTFRTPGVIEELVASAGVERVLFGSDIPLMDPRPQLGKIITAHISHRDKQQILGCNARRLLHL